MRINNGVGRSVKIKWDGITLPLKEGTPINIGGNIANNGTAIGLVMGTVYVKPIGNDEINILVGGDVDLAEVEKSSGLTLTTEAKANMRGIKFHLPDGTADDSENYLQDEKTKADIAAVEIALAPWQGSGSWYHAVVNASGEAFTVDTEKSDPINFSISATNYLVIPLDVQILDVKVKLIGEVQTSKIVRVPYDSFYVRYDPSATPVRIWLTEVDKFIGTIDLWFYAVEN